MSVLDYRKVEQVQCAGISITTFLTDCRSTVMVSVSDLVEQLCLDVPPLEDYEELEDYIVYDINGRQNMHYCVPVSLLNEFLWLHSCTKDTYAGDLDEFRKFFSYEVINFWSRFSHAADSLTAREALKVLNRRAYTYQQTLDIPPTRLYQFTLESLGYDTIVSRDKLSTEELAFVSLSEVMYASVVASAQTDGHSLEDSMMIADRQLEEPLAALGIITRGLDNL